MAERPDILIQNVSAQCIPNLVAIRTFRPKRIIWVHTPEFREALKRLHAVTESDCLAQEGWLVDARDVETMHRTLRGKFNALPGKASVFYHLTCGTKSMALQGLFNLGTFRRERQARVMGIVMNPQSQYFDVIYPEPVNHAFACAPLNLETILRAHGNAIDWNRPMRTIRECRARREGLERLRRMASAIGSERAGCKWARLHKDHAPVHQYELRRKGKPTGIGSVTRQALRLAVELGVAEGLSFKGNSRISYRPRSGSLIQYIHGDWLEDWVAAVLSELDWNGAAGASVHVFIGRKGKDGITDEQEADFLGARRNHLVYWSCKHSQELTQPQLFEVDAMRDELGGRDFHVSGIVHTGKVSPTMCLKAQRMGLKIVQALQPDAERQLIEASLG